MSDGAVEHPLTIRLKPSPALRAFVLLAHFAGMTLLLLMRLPLAATIPLVLMVAVSAVLALRAQARKRGLSLVLAADGALRMCREEGGLDAWARVLPDAVLFPGIAWFGLAWTAENGSQQRLRLMLVAAEVQEEGSGKRQWKRLRTWLRHRALNAEPEAVEPPPGDDLSAHL